jgi:alpha-mannosidase
MALLSPDGGRALTLVNDTTYGFDVAEGEVRLSLLRAPAYAGHPVDDVTPIVRQDRFEPREDQGEHVFRFWLDAGPARERLEAIDREAAVRAEGLMALCAFPSGAGAPAIPGVLLEDDVVRIGALKISEDGTGLVVRLFEPTGAPRDTRVRIPALGLDFPVALGPFELRTLVVDLATRTVRRADLLERPEVAP